jgi:hypothetical protein
MFCGLFPAGRHWRVTIARKSCADKAATGTPDDKVVLEQWRLDRHCLEQADQPGTEPIGDS